MATIADVARLAGVSKSTVSRALSRPEMLLPETVATVQDAAEKLGYVANSAARFLAGGRTGVIALVVPTLDNSFFAPIIGGAQARADAEGRQVTVAVHSFAAGESLTTFGRLARQVDGFIIVAPGGSDDIVRAAATKPAVLVDREIEGMSSAVADTASAFTLVVEHFARTGRRRLVYVGGPGNSWQDAQRTAAVRAAAERVGVSLEVVGPFPPTFAAGAEAARQVRELRPDAVIPYATALGLGIQHVYLVAGETPPVVSSERAIVEALGLAGVPAIDVDGRVLGDVAARLLSQRIQDPSGDPNRVRLSVPVTWGA
ncbi:LacI family transcriptional regulator [Microbacterium sorbitolivorans]|uniref:LacI family transcriptional regulator n=1 Tax=Microbacterium sorbitolivorans TaxID=1867410 RepID=A0A367Y4K9_9MICO|nr:LacI family DNA-binding transcriptional regulator [Microbacterium sorbitolivorans]RCK59972.1 LacI family transcriptional regulator [Microbacterium sorbitolivorans]GGF41558.1 LacI family transcriptional regulator [Microbacterium sorbitolivorans]